MIVHAGDMHFKALGDLVRGAQDKEIVIENCIGQRYIGAGSSGKKIEIIGTPGNALGAYLNGTDIVVRGNVQDAVGDTMNCGSIIVHGGAGDALGYAMRGGKIFIRGNVGYRCGIHMKAYMDFKPVIVIGGRAGSFLGEYQAGGLIVVLNLSDESPVVGNFCGTGMHGGEMYLRGEALPPNLPPQVKAERVEGISDPWVRSIITEYAGVYGLDAEKLLSDTYYHLSPNFDNPYHRMYTNN